MGKRENGFGPVKSWFETPAQRAERERRLQERSAPPIKKWQRTITQEQYLQAVAEGRSEADIVLKHFNNDPRELKKQLKDWGITEGEAVGMVQGTKTEITVTKDEYLKRRLNGEKRSSILRSLGLAGPKGYELLKEWGIREMDAEERELELLAPAKPASEVDKRVAEQFEQKSETRGLNSINQEREVERLRAELEEERAARKQDNETAARILEEEVCLSRKKGEELIHRRKEIEELRADASLRLSELEAERQLLLRTIEQAAGGVAGIITLHLPLMPVTIANIERARIYEAVEALSTDVEASEIDRERVMTELFDLLQRTVNFITADLAELHPGKDVEEFVREFFDFYNRRHMDLLTENEIKQAVYCDA